MDLTNTQLKILIQFCVNVAQGIIIASYALSTISSGIAFMLLAKQIGNGILFLVFALGLERKRRGQQ